MNEFSSEYAFWRFRLADTCYQFLNELERFEKTGEHGFMITDKIDLDELKTCIEQIEKIQEEGIQNDRIVNQYDSFSGYYMKGDLDIGGRGATYQSSNGTSKKSGSIAGYSGDSGEMIKNRMDNFSKVVNNLSKDTDLVSHELDSAFYFLNDYVRDLSSLGRDMGMLNRLTTLKESISDYKMPTYLTQGAQSPRGSKVKKAFEEVKSYYEKTAKQALLSEDEYFNKYKTLDGFRPRNY